MGQINEARKIQLKSQLENAVVEHIGTEADDYPSYDMGTYRVFVPGAIREWSLVKAEGEEEAKEKVRLCLERKLDAMSESDSPAEGVALHPDNLKVETKGNIEVSNG